MQAGRTVSLTFDPAELVSNLRLEQYAADGDNSEKKRVALVRSLYHLLRPFMPVNVRKHLQRRYLRGWERILFPRWPIDRSVDQLHEMLMTLAIRAEGTNEVPFVWFWPDAHSSCISITHDVETAAGQAFCTRLMDLNDSFGVKTSFQVIPEGRYEVTASFLSEIRNRGFEVNVHDLNHDGRLFFIGRERFMERVQKINRYGKEFDAKGFRSAVLYRREKWMQSLDFAYDMSVPNVAHLDPQRGGCCTVMPYFMGNLVEIPVTATQDYSLFHILGDYSTTLWEQQMAIIAGSHGLASFIIHPDYMIERQARSTYKALLALVAKARSCQNAWVAKPGEISDWWTARSRMRLLLQDGGWRIEGEGSERARIAYASLVRDRIEYRVEQSPRCSTAALTH